MNETSPKKNRQQLRRTFWTWLVFFIAIAALPAYSDLESLRRGDHQAPYWQQLLMIAIWATLAFGLWCSLRWTFTSWRNFRRMLVGFAIFATLIAIFYTEENWRGKRAWENCKRELEAKGAVLDWDKYMPQPVPDDQNFFTVNTNFYLRFVRTQTDEQGDAARHLQWLRLINYFTNESYSFPILDFAKSNQPAVAEISFTTVKNESAINLDEPSARDKIQNLIRTTVGRSINGAQGFQFSEFQLENLTPAKIILQADTSPSVADLENFISSDLVTNIGKLAVEATADPKFFQVRLVNGRITSAADYLKWSDQFVPAFDEVREALKRPYAIIPGDYSVPYQMPIPNFITLRALAQTLAQRAQCDFLLGKPDDALHEITLIHDVCRILEKPPTGKPETLVEAMINVAITGLYAGIVQDGLRRHVWQEAQLETIQSQMESVQLLPFVTEAFREEQSHAVQFATKQNVKRYLNGEFFAPFGEKASLWDKVKGHASILIPQGWIYQNLKFTEELQQKEIDCFDQANLQVHPKELDRAFSEINGAFSHYSPFHILASIYIPNVSRAIQTCAFNQTLVDQAQIACAMERYKLANGNYPETLEMLAPQFIKTIPHDIIGGQPLKYRRTDDGKFLLYSIGWNETDDGGQESPSNQNGSVDYTKGDWIWKN